MEIRAAEISSILKQQIASFGTEAESAEVGQVLAVGDGIARVYGLDTGILRPGKAADIALIDAPDGGTQDNALAAIRHGDIAAVGAVISGGEARFVGRSRNTPATTHTVRVASCKLPRDFSGARH